MAISSLSVDQDNPNHMTDRQRKALAENLKRYGFLIPIVANQDGLIADGQQRWEVAQSLGMEKVPVVKLPIKDVDRRILRQVLNKLKGSHEYYADASEYLKIIEAEEKQTLQELILLSDRELEAALDANKLGTITLKEKEMPEDFGKVECPFCHKKFPLQL